MRWLLQRLRPAASAVDVVFPLGECSSVAVGVSGGVSGIGGAKYGSQEYFEMVAAAGT
jgi:hypothetical protein